MLIPNLYPTEPAFYLRNELDLRQKRSPHYSMRAFARDLDISPSFLCEFLAGRQGLSHERVHWLAGKINLSEEQREHFWDLIEAKFGRTQQFKKMARVRVTQRTQQRESRLSLERFKLIADWYHFPLLDILSLPHASYSNVELAKILSIDSKVVLEGIGRLLKLGIFSSLVEIS